MNIQGGALEFDVIFSNGQIDRALEETKRRVQGFSKATVAGGEQMEAAYQAATKQIEKGFQMIGSSIKTNEVEINKLKEKFKELGIAAGGIYAKEVGGGGQYTAEQVAVQKQIKAHEEVHKKLQEQDAALVKLTSDLEDQKNKVDNASNAQVRFRTQLLNTKNEMMQLEQAGKKNTAEYARLVEEAKRLQSAMYAANQQVKILTSVKGATLQGFVSGISGLSGAFTAAQGAMGLFADKNEDLQRIMLKVQSLMSITMGLQAVSATLHQTSAFRLTVLTKVQMSYSAAVASTGKALIKFGMSATAARIAAQLLMATLTLGLGIAITAIITLMTKYISKQREAKKAVEEFNKKVAETAAKPIATINELSTAWSKLGDNIKAKEKFIDNNKDKFNSLGVSVKNVADAEKLLIQNKSKFIEAQLLKAKAIAAQELAIEKYKKVIEAQDKLDSTPKAWVTKNGEYTDGYGVKRKGKVLEKSSDWKKAEDNLNKAQSEFDRFQDMALEFSTQTEEILSELTENMGKLTAGSIAELEKEISKLKEQYENAATDLQRNDLFRQIQEKEKLLKNMDLLSNSKDKGKKEKDPFIEQLEKKKKAYQEYFKWINAGYKDEAEQEFPELLQGGKTYQEYLKNRREQLISEAEKTRVAVGEKMTKMFPGNVDLLARPMIDAAELVKKGWEDAGEGIATVFSSQHGILDKAGKETEILVTPILPDGTVLSQKELEEYIYNELQGAEDILKADKKGIVISVGVSQDGSAGETLHKLQEQYYITKGLSERQKEILHKLNTAIADETGKTVMSEWEKGLQTELKNARSILEMLDIIEKRRAALENDDSGLKIQKIEVLDKQQEDIVNQQEETTKQLIADYSDYLDKKIMLELELTNHLELLEVKRAKTTTDTDRKAIDNVISNRKKKYNEDKANLLRAGYEATRKLIDLRQNKELLNISKKAFTWEADRTKEMLETQKQAAQSTLKELQKIQEEAPTDEIAEEIEELKLKIKELNAELEKMPNEKFREMLSGFQKITTALGNLDGEIGEIFSNISSEIDNLKVAFDDTASKTDKISAGISAIVDIINMVTSASAERKKAEKEFYKNQIALVHEYALALNEQLRIQSELVGSGFVNNYAGKIGDSFNALADATEKYKAALDKLNEGKAKVGLRNAVDWGSVGKGAAAGAAAGAAIGSVVPVIGTALGAIGGAFVGFFAGLFGGKKKKETYGGLLEVFPELVDDVGNLNRELAESIINTNQVSEKTKQLIQNALDWADAVEEANKQIKEIVTDLAGDLGHSIKTAMIDAWKAGEDSSKKMFEAASQSLEKFIEDLIYSTVFSDIFDEFADRLAKSLSPTGDGDIIDDYDYLMDELDKLDDLYLASLEAIRDRAKQRSYDLWTPGEDANKLTSLSGTIKGASQESINVLTGYMNNTMVNQRDATELIRKQLFHLANIDNNTRSIDINTKYCSYLKDIYDKISNGDSLRSQGIADF
jgi:hypothetical protein